MYIVKNKLFVKFVFVKMKKKYFTMSKTFENFRLLFFFYLRSYTTVNA